jgi:hypothetical protein
VILAQQKRDLSHASRRSWAARNPSLRLKTNLPATEDRYWANLVFLAGNTELTEYPNIGSVLNFLGHYRNVSANRLHDMKQKNFSKKSHSNRGRDWLRNQ